MLAIQRIQRQRDIDNVEKYERSWYPCIECGGTHVTSWKAETG